ncbi:pantoate--beta-alanine ligase [Actibacterium atlanticum]|uniref:Pantothenate synthetase n=1 Tax=Actibacterium atlanticum TaxID=1461693 RepID=A0A058ZIJ9_9RHOB|nr:pantoate--beta-alanine ligase [Actibacterium atlanticum]KCV81393.1 pantoate--beta-alanine ligase [Actibacterium atlanticum]
MRILRRLDELYLGTGPWHTGRKTIGVVPTMGALHEGHLSLVRAAQAECDLVIVTIFVNPTQFNDEGDLETYPRTEEQDLAMLGELKVDAVYFPKVEEMYPNGYATTVSVAGVSEGLCGAGRPGHFDGVSTVVSKLLIQTRAHRAYFGEKDYQQLQVVKRVAADLDLQVEIVGCQTNRDEDGLARSSRNMHLTAETRAKAPGLYAAMQAAAAEIQAGKPVDKSLAKASKAITKAGYDKVEYLELRAADGLAPLEALDTPARLLAAAWLDGIRLIDNIAVDPV